MNKPVGAGVSSACFFPLETADSVKILSEWHIPNIEIFFNSFQELKDGYLNACPPSAGRRGHRWFRFTPSPPTASPFISLPAIREDCRMA